MKRDDKAKDLQFQGDAGWGVAQKDGKFISVEFPPNSGIFILQLRNKGSKT